MTNSNSPQLLAQQDGADFYDCQNEFTLMARYEQPFKNCSKEGGKPDWLSLEAAEQAAIMFVRDNPQYRLATQAELTTLETK